MIYGNGCKRKVEYPKSSPELDELATFISEDLLSGQDIYVNPMNKKVAIRVGRQFFYRHFKLHDIWQVDHDAIKKIIGEPPYTVQQLLDAEKECERYIHPFTLKIVFKRNMGLFDGELLAKTYTKELEEGIARAQASFLKVNLSSKVTFVTPPVYVHEITHSQLQSRLGSVRYYKNIEFLPLFLELVCSNEMTNDEYVLHIMEKFLANEIIKYRNELMHHEDGSYRMDRDQLLSTGKYLSSTISAFNLFVEYYQGTTAEKKYILQEIQKIFDGLQDLEEFTKRIGISDTINNRILQKHLIR
jgi:hypothetical protein